MAAPTPERSRLVLIGASTYEALPNLPSVRANVHALSDALQAPDLWGVPEENIHTVYDPYSATDIITAVQAAADIAADALLVYYAGHGITDLHSGELYLALAGTTNGAGYTAVRYDDIRRRILASSAKCRIVILDCCFSGRAIDGMAGGEHVLADDSTVDGTYVLTSAASTKRALAPSEELFTAFTGELITLVTTGIPGGPEMLDLNAIYQEVRRALKAKGRPEPQCRHRNFTGRLELLRNRSYRVSRDALEAEGEC
jgi:hypothetical protein